MSRMGTMAALAWLGAVLACRDSGEAGAARAQQTAAGDVALNTTAQQQQVDWKAVEAAIGRPGAAQPGDVYRFNFPRGDLRVTAGGVDIRPALALGGWVAMKAATGGVIAMGDLVVTEDELSPVISRLQAGGVEQTAVHHHVMRESPRVLYMHIHGHGDAVKIAETIRAAVALTKAPPPSPPAAATGPLGIDSAQVSRTLGHAGRVNGGVLQINVPRAETIREGSFEVPPSMGLGTVLNFQPTGGGKAAITGDFVLIASEVNPVIRTLRENGIEITSLHSHMLSEEPRLFFMHFWANDDAAKLARGLRAALDKTNSRRGTP
ncbi:MAG: DUF1259 domain-containing protein [Gemmatimonadaceae bacterium]